jgi:predicted nucleic acid-binding protein
MKIRPMVAELFHADKRKDGQMDRQIDEANTRFSQFCERAQQSGRFRNLQLIDTQVLNEVTAFIERSPCPCPRVLQIIFDILTRFLALSLRRYFPSGDVYMYKENKQVSPKPT